MTNDELRALPQDAMELHPHPAGHSEPGVCSECDVEIYNSDKHYHGKDRPRTSGGGLYTICPSCWALHPEPVEEDGWVYGIRHGLRRAFRWKADGVGYEWTATDGVWTHYKSDRARVEWCRKKAAQHRVCTKAEARKIIEDAGHTWPAEPKPEAVEELPAEPSPPEPEAQPVGYSCKKCGGMLFHAPETLHSVAAYECSSCKLEFYDDSDEPMPSWVQPGPLPGPWQETREWTGEYRAPKGLEPFVDVVSSRAHQVGAYQINDPRFILRPLPAEAKEPGEQIAGVICFEACGGFDTHGSPTPGCDHGNGDIVGEPCPYADPPEAAAEQDEWPKWFKHVGGSFRRCDSETLEAMCVNSDGSDRCRAATYSLYRKNPGTWTPISAADLPWVKAKEPGEQCGGCVRLSDSQYMAEMHGEGDTCVCGEPGLPWRISRANPDNACEHFKPKQYGHTYTTFDETPSRKDTTMSTDTPKRSWPARLALAAGKGIGRWTLSTAATMTLGILLYHHWGDCWYVVNNPGECIASAWAPVAQFAATNWPYPVAAIATAAAGFLFGRRRKA